MQLQAFILNAESDNESQKASPKGLSEYGIKVSLGITHTAHGTRAQQFLSITHPPAIHQVRRTSVSKPWRTVRQAMNEVAIIG